MQLRISQRLGKLFLLTEKFGRAAADNSFAVDAVHAGGPSACTDRKISGNGSSGLEAYAESAGGAAAGLRSVNPR